MSAPRGDLPAAPQQGGRANPGRTRPTGRTMTGRAVPEATVARLPVYLRTLTALVERGVATVSSEELAVEAGVNSAKLRKDLSHLGSYGTRGVGYDCQYLVYQISRELGLAEDWRVAIVGIGNLGHALANYGGFASRGVSVVALLDNDPDVVGENVAGLTVVPVTDLEQVVSERGVSIGVIATPGPAAQDVCDRLVRGGVTSILNFAPTVLQVPDDVIVRRVDLSTELQILAFHEQRRQAERELSDSGALADGLAEADPHVPAAVAGAVGGAVKGAVAGAVTGAVKGAVGGGVKGAVSGAVGDLRMAR